MEDLLCQTISEVFRRLDFALRIDILILAAMAAFWLAVIVSEIINVSRHK